MLFKILPTIRVNAWTRLLLCMESILRRIVNKSNVRWTNFVRRHFRLVRSKITRNHFLKPLSYSSISDLQRTHFRSTHLFITCTPPFESYRNILDLPLTPSIIFFPNTKVTHLQNNWPTPSNLALPSKHVPLSYVAVHDT